MEIFFPFWPNVDRILAVPLICCPRGSNTPSSSCAFQPALWVAAYSGNIPHYGQMHLLPGSNVSNDELSLVEAGPPFFCPLYQPRARRESYRPSVPRKWPRSVLPISGGILEISGQWWPRLLFFLLLSPFSPVGTIPISQLLRALPWFADVVFVWMEKPFNPSFIRWRKLTSFSVQVFPISDLHFSPCSPRDAPTSFAAARKTFPRISRADLMGFDWRPYFGHDRFRPMHVLPSGGIHFPRSRIRGWVLLTNRLF